MKTLNFLSDFWQKAKQAIDEIETELPKVVKEDIEEIIQILNI